MRPADNPFRAQVIARLPYLFSDPGMTWDCIIERVDRLGRRVVVIGPHGSGKTTFMNALAEYLEQAGTRVHRIQVREGQPWMDQVFHGSIDREAWWLLDGAGHISRIGWARLRWRLRNVRTIVITAHEATRLPTLHDTRHDASVFEQLVSDLAPDLDAGVRAALPEMIAQREGNLREVLRDLYDIVGRRDATTEHRRPGRESQAVPSPS